ncbi:MAG: phosphoribosylglycinamide formyltransferase [Rikenellaceae bacterium]|nr:phosphoribosylglycinamide formyltransferase [Rikenellaceae bacterium]
MKNIAIFASGSGTNAENIIRYFAGSGRVRVSLLLSNSPKAYALTRAEQLGVPTVVFDREEFGSGKVANILEQNKVDYLVLAGFLWLVPAGLIAEYRGRIVNIHPALLPRHGGKGMYGMRVHEAVVAAGDRESGITIHHVNEVYDSGDIIAQYRVAVDPADTPDDVARKVHELEYRYFPAVIEQELAKL